MCGNPNFTPSLISSRTVQKKNTSSNLVQQALQQAKIIDPTAQININAQVRIEIENFPKTHTKEMIQKVCEVFGTVKSLEMIKDPIKNKFRGRVQVEFASEMEATRAYNCMLGLKIEDEVLQVKKMQPGEGPQTFGDTGEVFRQMLDDKPTYCLLIKNVVPPEGLEQRIDYKEMEFDIQDEVNKYGRSLKVSVPRPPLFGDPNQTPGFGNAFILMATIEDAQKVKNALMRRKMNGKPMETTYFPEEKFKKGIFI